MKSRSLMRKVSSMADQADLAGDVQDIADEVLNNRVKRMREKNQAASKSLFVFVECLNCYEPSSTRFCCPDCRDDYEYRKSRQ